jgi:putative transposase
MSRLYRSAGISKQSFHQYLDRKLKLHDEKEQLLPVIRQIRKEYPTLSAREMYLLVRPASLGRDKFAKFCYQYGFKVEKRRAYHKTTNSMGVKRFPDKVTGRELTGVNQVWVSDITYYHCQDRFYYLTFITDKYTRKIVGYSVSKDLLTENTTIPALQVALTSGDKPDTFHSDGGGQYYCKGFLKLTAGITNSMGKTPYENPLAERINGLLKNDYIRHYAPHSYEQLCKQTARAVDNYNNKRQPKLRTTPSTLHELLTNEQLLTKEKRSKKEKSTSIIHTFIKPSKRVNAIQA